MAGQHDQSCSLHLREQHTLSEALRIRSEAAQIPVNRQGAAGFPVTAVKFEDLPSSEDLMSGQNVDSDTIFADELTARKYREVLLPASGAQDGTIPRTGEQKRAHVRVLFQAFKLVPQNSEEGAKMKEKFVKEEHNNHLVEVMCWELLEDCIRRSETSSNLIEAWEPGKAKGKAEQWTFAQRFNHLVEAMGSSKSICKHLFDVPFRIKLVDDPLRSSKRVASNRVLNQKKAESLKRGREAEKEDNDGAKRPKTENGNSTSTSTGAQVDNNLAPQTTRQTPQQPYNMGYAPLQPSTPTQQMRPALPQYTDPYAGQLSQMPPPPPARRPGYRSSGYSDAPTTAMVRQQASNGGPAMMARAQLPAYDPTRSMYYGVQQPSVPTTRGGTPFYLPGDQPNTASYHGNTAGTHHRGSRYGSFRPSPTPEETGYHRQPMLADDTFNAFVNSDAVSQAETSQYDPALGLTGNTSGSQPRYAQTAYHDQSALGTMAQGHVSSNHSTESEGEYRRRHYGA